MTAHAIDRSQAAGAPRAPAAEHITRVLSNYSVNPEYRLLELAAPPDALRATPGQFFHLLCPQVGNLQPFFRRPMSIYRIEPETRQLSFLYKVTGRGTRTMATLRRGDDFNILGPLGIGFSLPPAGTPIVIVARGVGLATLAPLVPLAAAANPVTCVLSARSQQVLMSVEAMRADGADVVTLTDAEGTSDVVLVERLLRQLAANGRMGAVYTCGSNRLLLLVQRLATEFALFGEVAMEQQMACGLGMCFCCVRSFRDGDGSIVHRKVCCEGPVFPLAEALSW